MKPVEPQAEHRWLQRLVGDWTYEHEAELTEPSGQKVTGTERVWALGDVWVLGEGEGKMPDGSTARSVITVGYDPRKKKFVGSFIGSMMTHFWPYEGSFDEAGKVLVLDSEGPSFTDETKTAKYQDMIEFVDDDHRTMTAQYLQDDGQWHKFMTVHYYRRKS